MTSLLLMSGVTAPLRAQPKQLEGLSRLLKHIYTRDQSLRNQLVVMDRDWQEGFQRDYDSLWSLQNYYDSVNIQVIDSLEDVYSWNGLMGLEDTSKYVIFMVIQHGDALHQKRYLPLILSAVRSSKMPPDYYALLKDRLMLGESNQQFYGTQLYWDDKKQQYLPFKIVGGQAAAEQRRKALKMSSLTEYLNEVKHSGD